MNKENSIVSHNYEAECDKLKQEMQCMERMHCEKIDALNRRIAELEHDLMIYEQKWSVIQMIFGK